MLHLPSHKRGGLWYPKARKKESRCGGSEIDKTEKRRIVMKFYICRHCGNIVTKLTSSKVPLHCCGQPMELLEAGVTDAAVEKHVPVVSVEGNLVKVAVGSVPHPMVEEHFIQWVAVETERDALIHWFHPGEAPEAVFALAPGQQVKAVYEYCNLHGLWKKEL